MKSIYIDSFPASIAVDPFGPVPDRWVVAAGDAQLAAWRVIGVVGDALRRLGDPAARIDPAQVARLLAVVRARLAEARDHA
jgi:hypothetical protein